jgi:hypothetical protein
MRFNSMAHQQSASCKHVFVWQAASNIIAILIAHSKCPCGLHSLHPIKHDGVSATLQLRVYALYDLNKWMLAVTGPLSLFTVFFAAVVHVWALSQSKVTSHDLPGTPYCIARNLPSTYWILWLPIIAFEAFLLALIICRTLSDDYAEGTDRRRSTSSMDELIRPSSRTERFIQRPWQRTQYLLGLVSQTRRIFYVLIRDSVLYFVV